MPAYHVHCSDLSPIPELIICCWTPTSATHTLHTFLRATLSETEPSPPKGLLSEGSFHVSRLIQSMARNTTWDTLPQFSRIYRGMTAFSRRKHGHRFVIRGHGLDNHLTGGLDTAAIQEQPLRLHVVRSICPLLVLRTIQPPRLSNL